LVNHTPSQGNYAGGVWTVGGLGAGGSATLTLLTQVNLGTGGSLITNTALIIAANQPDPNFFNNIAFANVNVRRVADLSLGKTVDNPNPNELDNVVFTVTLTNIGPNSSFGITVSDLLPGGLSFVSANATQGTYGGGAWSLAGLPGGTNATLWLTAQANAGTGGSPITNTANITAASAYDPDPANNSASATLTVQIPPPPPPPPSPPVANGDSASTPVDTPVIIDVLANDTDADGNIAPGSVTIVNPPTSGTINNIDAGTGAITLQSSVAGPDSFTYQVCDTTLLCASATVSVDVTP
jgi:uncharacterized repeat protein (TIGR01451 family)